MSTPIRSCLICMITFISFISSAQNTFSGRIIDITTKEPVNGASLKCAAAGCNCGCATGTNGQYHLRSKDNCCNTFSITSVGYESRILNADQLTEIIYLQPAALVMNELVISASRETITRSLAPVAISNISSKMIQDAKPISFDQVLNKVSGIYMVNHGNEQHSMSIRQPMTTKSLFLYLEDGIPLRTTGLFNHNAMIELNMSAIKNIEVIKGPSSSLYGSEAIGGVVNFITATPPAIPVARLSMQGNSVGYRRADLQSGFTSGKWGFSLSGYFAGKRDGFIQYSDFTKTALTARIDYRFNEQTSLVNTITWIDYKSDMYGSIDSTAFANRSFKSQQTFTFRNVKAFRYRSTVTHKWNEKSTGTLSIIYRDNQIDQNPAYSVRDDYRRSGNGNWIGKKDVAHGEINRSAFRSYMFVAQQRQQLNWKKAKLVAGLSADLSPSKYHAEYIKISRDSINKRYTSFTKTDSILTSYSTGINNYAAFANFEFDLLPKMRIVGSIRYDVFRYNFRNALPGSSFSGAPDSINTFKRLSPKVGFTYNFSPRSGVYANYSEGFVPPQVTEMYRGVKVADLKPSVFYNYEIGGWMEIIKNKIKADVSLYLLNGTDEVISMKMDDGTFRNMNAGRTTHKGIEFGIHAAVTSEISARVNGAVSDHRFIDFVEKGASYNNNQMNSAPRWMYNAEAWYRPTWLKGSRVGLEWQRIGSYFMDPVNTVKYDGFNVINLRLGYKWKSLDTWCNIANITGAYYAYNASKSNSGYSYMPGEPRNITFGISYDFGSLTNPSK